MLKPCVYQRQIHRIEDAGTMETQEIQNDSSNACAPTPEPNTNSTSLPSNPPVYSEPPKESSTWYPGPPPEPYPFAEPPQYAAARSAPQFSPQPAAEPMTGGSSYPPQMMCYVAAPFPHQQHPRQQPQQVNNVCVTKLRCCEVHMNRAKMARNLAKISHS